MPYVIFIYISAHMIKYLIYIILGVSYDRIIRIIMIIIRIHATALGKMYARNKQGDMCSYRIKH